MDDNLSTKSSESSITTSGEYEIVTDSNITSPLEQPSLDIANNRNISDIQHAMTDALKELELEKSGDGGGGKCLTSSLMLFVYLLEYVTDV